MRIIHTSGLHTKSIKRTNPASAGIHTDINVTDVWTFHEQQWRGG